MKPTARKRWLSALRTRTGEERRVQIERIPWPFASIYEKATGMVVETYYVPLAEKIVLTLEAGRVLDLGTGPGHLPIEIVKRSPSIWVDGIDLSRTLIHRARSNASRAGVAERLHFEVGNASRLRFPDQSYDMVISTGMLHALRDPVQVLRECNRVLRPGGKAWIFDPARVCSCVDIRKWKAAFTLWERFMHLLFLRFAGINPGRTYDRRQVVVMIEAARFREYEIQQEGRELRIKVTK
jgi:ubiquinone/menaquinone biosynthesis C-methylase UbiE